MKYPAYSEYSDFEPDWLGTLPKQWSFRRLRFTASEPLTYGANEAAVLDDRELPRYIRITDVKDDGTLHDDTFRSLEEHVAAPYLLQDGDILLARSGATVGKSFQYLESWGKAAYAGYLIRYRTDRAVISARFANYYFQTTCYWARINSSLIQSTIENFSAEKYKDLKLPLPPVPEQQQIAAFLDWKTGQIDALIAKKQELLEKLKEKRLAVITQAVTRGLNPDVPLRDSGVSWIGRVPEHWLVGGFTKFVEHIADYRGKTPEKVREGVFLITARNIKNGAIDYDASQEYVSESDYRAIMIRGLPMKGDLLFTTEAPLGEIANIDREDVALAQRVIKFRCEVEKLNNYFAKYWMMSLCFQAHLQSLATGSTAVGIKASKLFALRAVIPPCDEQAKIVDYLDEVDQKFDVIKARTEDAIRILTEYRTALITAATTGKIDVRGLKIPAAN